MLNLSQKIYQCRKKAGLSQEALAEVLGVSRQAVSKWETGEAVPELSKLVTLARVFQVSTDWLLGEDESEEEDIHEQTKLAEAGKAEPGRTDKLSEFLNGMPDFLSRLIKKYGWLYGIYQALGGFVLFLTGLLIRAMGRSFGQTVDSFGFGPTGGGVSYYDEAGHLLDPAQMSPGMQRAVNDAIGISSSPVSSAVTGPFDTMGNFVLIIGLVFCATGLLLAWYLYSISKK